MVGEAFESIICIRYEMSLRLVIYLKIEEKKVCQEPHESG